MADERKNPVTVTLSDDGTFAFHGRSMQITADKNRALEPYGRMLFNYGVQMQLLPDDSQAEEIRQFNGCARVAARAYLDARKAAYDEKKQTLSVADYKKNFLPSLKEELPFLKEADKFAIESAIEHVDRAYKNFFEGRGRFPKNPSKYKPNGNRYTTKQTSGNISVVMRDGVPCLKLPKIGPVRFVIPKGKALSDICPEGSSITSATVIKDGRNYLVSLQMERVVEKPESLAAYSASELIAMDMGLKYFCDYGTAGSGASRTKVENPRWIKKHEKRLRRLQKALARKQYDVKTHTGSRNYYKAKDRVAKEQRKIANQRKDFHHKLSRKIADSCKVFVCEDLNIRGMMKNRHLAKAVASAGWGQFLSMVRYKIEKKGGIFLKVSRWFPSSKECSHCGYHKDDLQLSERYWICPECHTIIDRDDNAVDNLAKEGMRLLGEMGIHMAPAA